MMNNRLKETTFLLLSFIATVQTAHAQDRPEVSVGADIVSGYIWRGQELGGFTVMERTVSFGMGFGKS